MPAGTIVRGADGKEWPVAENGVVYVGGVKPGALHLSAKADEVTCQADIIVPKKTADVPNLGNVTCK